MFYGQARVPVVKRGAVFLGIWLGALFGSGLAGATSVSDHDRLLTSIRTTTLDPDRAVRLTDAELPIGAATMHVEDGVLIPTHPIEGTTVEWIFLGQANLRLDAPDDIEAEQLELFTGHRSLKTPIHEAALVWIDPAGIDQMLARYSRATLSDTTLKRAGELHQLWLGRTERRTTGLEAAIFKSLLGDTAFGHYFAVWCRSSEIGEFVYQLDPEDVEQLTLANFNSLNVGGWERQRLSRHIRIQQRKGRWLGLDVQDLGAWDLWLSTPWSPKSGEPLPGNLGFEAEHYDLDVTIKRRSFELEGTATVDIRAQTDGRRAVTLELFRDLVVERVTDQRGRELFFFRSGNEVVVALPEPSRVGERMKLEVHYGGRVLRWVSKNMYDLENTASWYPHCGTVDRATYDVMLRWPEKLDLLAAGKKIGSGKAKGYRWEQHRLDRRSIAFSFVLGKFEVETLQVGHVAVTLALNQRTRTEIRPAVRQQVRETVGRALQYFETRFGPYPLDELTVVTLPRAFSQSYLSFITLSDSILFSDAYSRGVGWLREMTIAHEIAHQWWGNMIGWWSYRDQWLSEAIANYAGLLYYSHKEGVAETFLADMSAGWRDSLGQTTVDGRTVESLGPIVLGARLDSSRASNGYRAIVYRKGAVVLAMLARIIGEEKFLGMLRSLAQGATNRVVTTEMFVEALERMSGMNLEGFSRQFIYGTGIPRVYYEYDKVRSDDGKWKLLGYARVRASARFQHRIERRDGGIWDMAREVRFTPEINPTGIMVPFRVLFDENDIPEAFPSAAPQRRGEIFIDSSRHEFELQLDRKPAGLELDPEEEILAHFYTSEKHPKRVAFHMANDLALGGDRVAAERAYREALKLDPDEGRQAMRFPLLEDRRYAATTDVRIRLALARMFLEDGRDDEARHELDAADLIVGDDFLLLRVEREALRSRLEFRRGEFRAGFKRLRRTLRFAIPNGPVYRRRLAWQVRLRSEREAMIEGLCLLAIAAHETDDRKELEWALTQARERAADVSALERVVSAKRGRRTRKTGE